MARPVGAVPEAARASAIAVLLDMMEEDPRTLGDFLRALGERTALTPALRQASYLSPWVPSGGRPGRGFWVRYPVGLGAVDTMSTTSVLEYPDGRFCASVPIRGIDSREWFPTRNEAMAWCDSWAVAAGWTLL